MKKLIVVDIDGTLVNDEKKITPKTRDALISAIKAGHEVMIASGRPSHGIRAEAEILGFDKFGGLLSAYNGGEIYDFKNKKVLASHPIAYELAKEICDFAKNLDLVLMIPKDNYILAKNPDNYYVQREARVCGMDIKVVDDLGLSLDFSPNKLLFAQDPERIDQPARMLFEKFGDRTAQVKSTRFFYEIMPLGLSKGSSILEACKIFGIDKEDVIVFGDEMNDMSMFEVAGTGVAMGNAVDPIKKLAAYVTKSNNEDGIAFYLENFLLNKENK